MKNKTIYLMSTIKKHLLNFAIFALIMFVAELSLNYINHKSIDADKVAHAIKLLLLTGITFVPLSLYFEKRKENKNPKNKNDE